MTRLNRDTSKDIETPIKERKYYIIKANGKYYDILNPFKTFTLTIVPTPSDATVTLSGLTATKGNLGTTSTTTGTGGSSLYNGYGKGGNSSKSSRQNGTPGYFKIVAR